VLPNSAAPPVPLVRGPSQPSKGRGPNRVGKDAAGLVTSFVLHLAILLVLALLLMHPSPSSNSHSLRITFQSPERDHRELDLTVPIADPWEEAGEFVGALSLRSGDQQQVAPPQPVTAAEIGSEAGDDPSRTTATSLDATATLLAEATTLLGGGWGGRTGENRARLVRQRGGSGETEAAVESALRWIADHQLNHGGWKFDFRDGPCQGRCRHHGTLGTKSGATALALLPLLGAGNTTDQGPYAETVRRGFYYLISRRKETHQGIDFRDTNMYDQGLATIALSEAYGMTGDESLVPMAQGALDFICRAQHPMGGWRYYPREPGDMTVTGWQLMALKSGRMAGLDVPSPVIQRAIGFLNELQSDYGAAYGYLRPGKQPSPTAIGLLLRMYLGWGADDDRLENGAAYLARLGPSNNDMYFNYYATQVLSHLGGDRWEQWNLQMRDHLLQTQVVQGHETGSWHFSHEHADEAGRLYSTAMCTMILEVYYRHLPLFDPKSVEHRF